MLCKNPFHSDVHSLLGMVTRISGGACTSPYTCNTYIHTHTCAHTHKHTCASTHTHTHIHKHTRTHAHTHTHTCTHTHTHTQSHDKKYLFMLHNCVYMHRKIHIQLSRILTNLSLYCSDQCINTLILCCYCQLCTILLYQIHAM